MRIEVDRSRCAGLGMCEERAPELFEVGDDGSVVILDEEPGEDLRETVQAAMDACPTEALYFGTRADGSAAEVTPSA